MKRFPITLFLTALSLTVSAQNNPQQGELLDSTVVSARRAGITLASAPGDVSDIAISAIRKIPSVFGSGDPLRFTAYLPSVQTGHDLDSGLHIQGCENAHSCISMDGAPVYGAGHMLGFASVFNPGHFSGMTYSTIATKMNRLGGVVDVSSPSSLVYKPGLDASAGLFLSHATLSIPAGSSSFFLSARHSFFNLLYKDFLLYNDEPFRYDFGDCNVSWLLQCGADDTISLNAYYGKDSADYGSQNWGIDAMVRWSNAMSSLRWKHIAARWALQQTIYGSFFLLEDDIRMNVTEEKAPAHIQTYGYKAEFTAGGWEILTETAAHFTLPMQPSDVSAIRQYGQESSVQPGYTFRKGRWMLSASLRGTWYLSPQKKTFWSADPKFEAAYTSDAAGTFGLRTGTAHQYLFQTGPVNMGFPCEYWILAGDFSNPQSSRYVSLCWDSADLWPGWTVSFESYYRNLSNQLEFNGSILSYTSPDFRLQDHLIAGKGHNYGINVTLQKTKGNLTGWISYAYGRALRHSDVPGWPEWYPSDHERLHEFNLVSTYDFGKWDIGLILVSASGRPYTSPDAFYISGGKIMTVFGSHNAGRLDPYFRADLSVNRYFRKTTALQHGINLSVYNVTSHGNEVARMLKIDEDGKFCFDGANLVVSILPSIAYFIRF